MKASRNKRKGDTETFCAQLLFTRADVIRTLNNDYAQLVDDDPMDESFWKDFLATSMTQISTDHVVLKSLWQPVSDWAFSLAVRHNFLVQDVDESLYYRNTKLLERSRRGPKPSDPDDTDE